MTDTTITQLPLFDDNGNIQIHGLDGLDIAITFLDSNGDPVNMTGRTVSFVVNKYFTVALTPGTANNILQLTVPQTLIATLPLQSSNGTGPYWAIVDETTTWDVQSEGMILVRGFTKVPS